MLIYDALLRTIASVPRTVSEESKAGSCSIHIAPIGRNHYRCHTSMKTLIAIVAMLVLIPLFMGGCQERVISRSGIGADELNPHVSEPEGNDRLSNYIWNDKKK